jgi:hypothetical protein
MIGKALRGIRAGDKHLAWNDPALSTVPVAIRLRLRSGEVRC